MRRLITAIVVPIALLTALAITASAADAGNGQRAAKTTAKITSMKRPPPDHTWVFKGKVTSKKKKCIARRRVSIFPVAPLRAARGDVPPGPTAVGKTKKNGRFSLNSGQDVILFAPYVAVVEPADRKGVTCNGATSPQYSPL
jgi:hypothetical protein